MSEEQIPTDVEMPPTPELEPTPEPEPPEPQPPFPTLPPRLRDTPFADLPGALLGRIEPDRERLRTMIEKYRGGRS